MLLTHNLNSLWSSLTINELISLGVHFFYIAPGYRSGPLLQALIEAQKEHPHLHIISGFDERSLSFRALGALNAGQVVALICTSGTALANFYPAVIEAFRSELPLFLLTADRPIEMVKADTNQTIDQVGLYGKFVKKVVNFPTPSEKFSPQIINHWIDEAHNVALEDPKGPIHFNLPFSDGTLGPEVEIISEIYLKKCSSPSHSHFMKREHHHTKEQFEELFIGLDQERGVLIWGPGDYTLEEVKRISQALEWPTLFDCGSGLKSSLGVELQSLPDGDHPSVLSFLENYAPTTIWHFGQRLLSQKIVQFIQQRADTLKYERFMTAPGQLQNGAYTSTRYWNLTKGLLSYFGSHLPAYFNPNRPPLDIRENLIQRLKNLPYSQLLITHQLLDALPNHHTLYLGNSLSIRMVEATMSLLSNPKPLNVMTHRGVSGIEGFMASSLGYFDVTKNPITLLIGDLSFLHDIHSLIPLSQIRKGLPITIIIFNNNGGGIFERFPLANNAHLHPYLFTPHNLSFAQLADSFHLQYQLVSNEKSWRNCLQNHYKNNGFDNGPTLIEIVLDKKDEGEIFSQYSSM